MVIPKASPRPRLKPRIPLPILALPSGRVARATVFSGALIVDWPTLFTAMRKKNSRLGLEDGQAVRLVYPELVGIDDDAVFTNDSGQLSGDLLLIRHRDFLEPFAFW